MKKSANKLYFLLIMLAFTGYPAMAGYGQQAIIPPKKDELTAPNTSTIGNVTSSPRLQGGIEKIELNLEKLQDIGIDLKVALRATSSLYDEVTIQPVRIITQPSSVGPSGTIINIPVGTEPVGPPQPARKDHIDRAIKSLKLIVHLLKNNVDDFADGKKQMNLSNDVQTELEPRFKDWISLVNSIASKQKQLELETKAPPYENQVIATLTASMQTDIKNLEKTRATIYKVMRKQEKRAQRNQKK